MKKQLFILFVSLCALIQVVSQNDSENLLLLLDDKPPTEYTSATFKATRLVNFHTVEVLGKRCLDFRISHRFGELNTGMYNAFGLDGGANIRLGLEYSNDGRLMFGAGRTSSQKIIDGFVKYKLLRQTTDNKMPVTLTLFSSMFYTFENRKIGTVNYYNNFTDRMSYFSGIVTRFKITKRQAITLEYAARLNKYSLDKFYDSFAIGYDVETGGHVFQVHLTNSLALTENQFYMYTRTSWSDWGVRIGFNISRVFAIGSSGY
jgi:hypothetical protein